MNAYWNPNPASALVAVFFLYWATPVTHRQGVGKQMKADLAEEAATSLKSQCVQTKDPLLHGQLQESTRAVLMLHTSQAKKENDPTVSNNFWRWVSAITSCWSSFPCTVDMDSDRQTV